MPDRSHNEHEAARYASLQDYLRVFRERWIQIVAVAMLVGMAALVYSAVQPKSYEASARLKPRQQALDAALVGDNLGPLANPQSQAAELSALASQEVIAERTAENLDAERSAASLLSSVGIGIEVQTNLVVVTARDEDPKLAADLANEYAREIGVEATRIERERISGVLEEVRRQLKQSGGSGLVPSVLQARFNELQALKGILQPVAIVSTAGVPRSPVAPQPARNTILGLLIGLFVGVVIAFARDATDTRLKAPRDAEIHFGIPRLGQLSDDAFARTASSSNGRRELSPLDMEAARIIRTNLEHLAAERPLGSLAITSSLPGEGKSTVAVALASAAALSGTLPLLMECDLRQPVIAARLGLDRQPGLSEVLSGEATPREALQVVDVRTESESQLVCLTAGSAVADPARLLASEQFYEMLIKVKKVYEMVIIDTSPLLSVVDTRELLPLVDGLVVCSRAYQTTQEQARAAREALENIPIDTTGLVVTGVPRREDDYYSYYYQYGYGTPALTSR